MHRAKLSRSAARACCWAGVWLTGTGMSGWQVRAADLNAGELANEELTTSVTLWLPLWAPPTFGSGKFGTPCRRMQSAYR